jgi:ACR3 family arsenite efflux pump ArsB
MGLSNLKNKYKWYNDKLRLKFKSYWNYILSVMGIELILYFVVHNLMEQPMTFYWIAIPLGIAGCILWYLSYKIQQQDKQLWYKAERDREKDI